jgi:hypothetical protein
MKALRYEKLILSALILALTLGFLNPLCASPNEGSDKIIAAMISAHGGMQKWKSAPTVSFEDQFLQAGAPKPMTSHVTVEQGRRRAYLDFPESNARIAWDGKEAWSENWKAPIPPRFLALLNYYFLNLPWLTSDRGVHLSEPGKAKLWEDPTEYITVKMTFGAEVGDTPDDYYVLYIDPKTQRLKACEYIATYASVVPPGTKPTPHILVYENFETIDGLVVPTRYSIYDKNQKRIASCEIRNWSFKKTFDASRMTKSANAVVDTSKPKN